MTAVPLMLYLARRDGNRDNLSGGSKSPTSARQPRHRIRKGWSKDWERPRQPVKPL